MASEHPPVDTESVLYRTSVHEAGHVAVALSYGVRVVYTILETEETGFTMTESENPDLAPSARFAEHLLRTSGAVAAAGNVNVAIILDEDAAEAERQATPDGPDTDAAKMEDSATALGDLRATTESIDQVIESFKAEAREVLDRAELRDVSVRLAQIIYRCGTNNPISGIELLKEFDRPMT